MTKNHTQQKPLHFKPRALVLAVRRALPFLVAFSLGAALVGPAAGRSGENAAAFTATQLIRQFTLKNTVAQVSQGMQGHVQEVNGFLRAPAMGVRPSGFPADMGSVPGTVNLPRRDGAGRPLGYCAWDNASASSDANHLAGSGVPNPLAYAVISPGLNGTMETTCANVLATGAGQGDDFVQVTAPAQASSKQFKSAVGTVVELQATPAEEGDVRLVAENNKLYSYLGGIWVPVDGSKFADDSVANGAGALAYIAGKVTVADFQAASATITGALAADSATFTNGVTAATFTGSGSGLTDLNAGNISSGVLGAAFGGTGVDGSAAAQGSLLIGTGAGFALGAITAGDGIGVLNGAGSITISNTGVLSITGTADQIIANTSNGDVVLSLPQSIATTSTPTFAGMMLNGALTAPSAMFTGDISARRLYLSDSSGGVTTPNLVIGLGAMAAPTSGNGANTAVGIGALAANTTGDKNTAIGEGALNANLTGHLNVAVGHSALRDNTTGGLNTALGSSALRFNISGANNTAVGDGALYNNLTGDLNTAVGRAAMITNIDGYNNSAFGEAALYNNASGYENVAVGKHTMMSNTSGFENTAIGLEALWHNSTGTRNVALGRHAGFYNEDGSNNTFLGTSSAPESGSLNFATAIGASSRVSTDNTIVLGRVTDRTVIGATGADGSDNLLQVTGNAGVSGDLVLTQSGAGSTLGSKIRFGGVNEETDPISLGRINSSSDNSILQLTLGDNQVDSVGGNGDRFQIALTNGFVGHTFDSNGNAYHAGNLSVGSLSTGRLDIANYTGVAEPNIIIGPGAMLSAQSGSGGNVALGIHVMESNSSGARNTALGSYAMHFNTTGIENTAVGFEAMGSNSSGYYNTAVGESALLFNTTGFSNVAMGNSALRNNITGWENIAIGQDALFTNTAGVGNLAFGYESLKFLNSGSSNIGIGYDALENLQSGSRNVAIGNEAGERDGSRTLSFGSDNTFLGAYTGPAAGVNTLNFGTAIGAYAEVSTNNTIVLGRTTDKTVIGATGDDGSGNLLQVTGNAGISGTLNAGVLQAERMNIGSNAGGVTHTNIGIGHDTLSAAQSGNGGNLAVGQQVLQNNTTGHYNTGLGIYALSANQTGARNTAVGYSALVANTTGSRNSVVGYRALYSNLTGEYNVAMGYYAMQFSTQGSYNVVLGNFGLGHNTTGHSNSLLGDSAMFNNSTGFENVAVGRYALYNNGGGEGNVAVGYNSTSGLSSGSENTILGRYSMDGLTTGSRNVALGAEAGSRDAARMLTSGSDNTFLGAYSGPASGVGTLNFATAVGAYAQVGTDNTVVLGRPSHNTVIGATGTASSGALSGNKLQVTGSIGASGNFVLAQSGSGSTPGSQIFFGGNFEETDTISLGRINSSVNNSILQLTMGDDSVQSHGSEGDRFQITTTDGNVRHAFDSNGSAYHAGTLTVSRLRLGNYDGGVGDINFAIGFEALAAAQSGDGGNVAVGEHVLEYNSTGAFNTALGNYAMHWNETGSQNTAVGYHALQDNVSGSSNTAMGRHVMFFNTTGSSNTAVGDDALAFNTSGNMNVAVGHYALYANPEGFENTAIGYDSIERLTDGAENTALGSFALNFLTTGSRNTAIGSESASRDVAYYLTSGSDNSFLGAYSGPASGFNTLNFATAIGAYAQVSTSNTVVLGRASDTVVIGATGNDSSGNKLQVTGSVKATAFNTSSDRRLKNSITQLHSGNLLSQLQQLNAYHYRFNSDPSGQIRYGVIAQEVATLFPHAVSYDGQGLMAVDYGALGAIAASAVGQLSTQVTALDKQVKTNTENISTLTDRMGKSEGKIEALESWKTQADSRMDNLQTAIDKNIADIAKNAVAITANTQRIDTLEEVTALLDARTSEHGSLIAVLQAQWSDTFSRADNGQTLVVNAPNLKASNFTAQQASIGTLYSERLMAEMAKIKALEVDSLLVNSAQARTVRAEEVNTGSAQVYAGVGLPALLFAASGDGHYTVNTSALDGSYATATVIVNAGQAKIVPVASEGIELIADGNTVKAIAAGKSIKASWIKMG